VGATPITHPFIFGGYMNWITLQRWFSESPELFLAGMLLVLVGFLSSVFWVGFLLAKAGLFSAAYSTKITLATLLCLVAGITTISYANGRVLEGFGYSLTIGTGFIFIMHWIIRWTKWVNNW
jgi:hypothetical protein